jgi:hypothetical protein
MRTTSKRWLVAGLACAALTLGIAVRQVLALTSHSGCQCVASAGSAPGLKCGPGASNSGTGAAGVYCPLSLATQPSNCVTVTDVVVRYLDNNAASPFYCSLLLYGADGLLLYSGPRRYTCAQAGGCASDTPAFTGAGFLQLTPTGAGTTNCVDQDYEIHCVIPSPGTASALSSVVSYHSTP